MPGANRCRPDARPLQEQFEELDATSRQRVLTIDESLRLENIIKEIDHRNGLRKRQRRNVCG